MSQEELVSIKTESRPIYDYEYEPVPPEVRKRWYVIALVWIAIGIDVSGLFLGTYLSSGLSFGDALVATLAGSAILGVLAACCANVGYGTGLSTSLLSIAVFGKLGGKLIGVISSICLVGWFAFQLDFFSVILQKALIHYDIMPGRVVLLCFGTLLMASTAIWGVRSLAKLSVFSVPLMVGLIVVGIAIATENHEMPPAADIKSPISMGSAISYVVSIWIMTAVMSPDFARYAKTRKDAIVGAGLGFLVGNSAIIIVALLLSHLLGSDDLIEIFFSIGFGVSAVLILIFAQWTTNSSNLIMASLGLSVVFRTVPRPVVVIILAIVGLLIANNGILDNFTIFLSLLGVFISPIAGVYLMEYYFLGAKWIKQDPTLTPAINYMACIAWLVGCAISLLTSSDFGNLLTLTTISALDGVFVSTISYCILKNFSPNH